MVSMRKFSQTWKDMKVSIESLQRENNVKFFILITITWESNNVNHVNRALEYFKTITGKYYIVKTIAINAEKVWNISDSFLTVDLKSLADPGRGGGAWSKFFQFSATVLLAHPPWELALPFGKSCTPPPLQIRRSNDSHNICSQKLCRRTTKPILRLSRSR